jgi:hypothetical protein
LLVTSGLTPMKKKGIFLIYGYKKMKKINYCCIGSVAALF